MSISTKKRKITVISGFRSEYLKLRSALFAIQEKKSLELQVVSIGAHNLPGYGNTVEEIKKDGFNVVAELKTNVEGNDPQATAGSVAVSTLQVSAALNLINPDLVLLAADRFEIFGAAVAAVTSGFPVAHVQGGEKSGTLDDALRHAITKLAHLHFPATEESAKRICKMGENPEFVYNSGCCAIDYIKSFEIKKEFYFPDLGWIKGQKFGIILQHPVFQEVDEAYQQMSNTLEAVQNSGLKCVLIYCNPDAGADAMRKAIRHFETVDDCCIVGQYKNISMEKYLNLLYHSACLIGNSSSGIREAHAFGIPVINIGTRQQGRERTKNIINTGYEVGEIEEAIKKYSGKRIWDKRNIYGDGKAGEKIADVLESLSDKDLKRAMDKKFYD